jgi:hypothetical protein
MGYFKQLAPFWGMIYRNAYWFALIFSHEA